MIYSAKAPARNGHVGLDQETVERARVRARDGATHVMMPTSVHYPMSLGPKLRLSTIDRGLPDDRQSRQLFLWEKNVSFLYPDGANYQIFRVLCSPQSCYNSSQLLQAFSGLLEKLVAPVKYLAGKLTIT